MTDHTEMLARQIRDALGEYNNDDEPVVVLVDRLHDKAAQLEDIEKRWKDACQHCSEIADQRDALQRQVDEFQRRPRLVQLFKDFWIDLDEIELVRTESVVPYRQPDWHGLHITAVGKTYRIKAHSPSTMRQLLEKVAAVINGDESIELPITEGMY